VTQDEGVFQFKAPPHSLEAEQSLLGALLLSNDAYDRVSWLTDSSFYSDKHRRLWRALARCIEAGRPADVFTICEELGDDLEKAGGPAYIGGLAQNTPSAYNVHRYAELVRDKAILRNLYARSMEIAEKAIGGATSALELADEAGGAFMAIDMARDGAEAVEMGRAALDAAEWADNPIKGLPTGFRSVDDIFGGLMPGDLIIVAGRPSMGKTALAMNIAEEIATETPVAVFSMEMTRRKVAGRSLKYHESMVGRDAAMDHLSSLKLYIDDSPALSIGYMRLRMRRIQRKHGLGLVVVDYLQLMQAKAENRTQEVSAISRGLKALAKEFNVPVIAVAQLNRGAEARADNRPVLSDLRESGQIEQDADIIAFVYRDEYYKPETEWRGIAEVIVRKNRDGAIGTAYLNFIPEYTRFKPLDRPLPPRNEPPARGEVKNFSDYKTRAAGE
jgi:replicative DNA helicase